MTLDASAAVDEGFIRQAIILAQGAVALGEVPVAAILTIGELSFAAANEKERRPDPTAHAEILVLRAAAAALGRWRLSDATVYITKEPCMMCAGALIAARVARVVFGAFDPKAGAAGSTVDLFTAPGINHYVEVCGGICGPEAAAQLSTFFREKRRR